MLWPWVVLPNVMGMGLSADGGKIGSKPYISSGAYLHKMSNACQSCHYRYDALSGETACPFNALYWNHIAKHALTYQNNPRMSMIAMSYQKFSEEKKQQIQDQAHWLFSHLETL